MEAGAIKGLTRRSRDQADKGRVAETLDSLERQFELSRKISDEPETLGILQQLFERLFSAYGYLSNLTGMRILDIACGSRSSRAPAGFPTASPVSPQGYTALFEPWFCRILFALGAKPVGIDIGDLNGEQFEHYEADVSRAGALDFLPQQSFDAVHDSRLFGSPEFTARFPDRADALRIAREIVHQEDRLLKRGGIVIHSDARRLSRAA